MAEILSVLFFREMRYKLSEPRDKSSDRFVLSKGHAAPILYAAWAEAGLFPTQDLLNLRKVSIPCYLNFTENVAPIPSSKSRIVSRENEAIIIFIFKWRGKEVKGKPEALDGTFHWKENVCERFENYHFEF